jgi:hypothetical protein
MWPKLRENQSPEQTNKQSCVYLLDYKQVVRKIIYIIEYNFFPDNFPGECIENQTVKEVSSS